MKRFKKIAAGALLTAITGAAMAADPGTALAGDTRPTEVVDKRNWHCHRYEKFPLRYPLEDSCKSTTDPLNPSDTGDGDRPGGGGGYTS